MNRNSDVEFVLRTWLAEGTDLAPDRVLDVVAERIARQPRRAGRLRRRPFVNAYLKLAAGIAAVTVIGVVAWQLAPPSPGPGAMSSEPPTSPPTVPPPTGAAPWWLWEVRDGVAVAVDECGDGTEPLGCAGELTAGTHTSTGFDPEITYTVPAGWVNGRDWANDFSLFPATEFTRAWFSQFGGPAAEIAVHRIDLRGLVCPTPPATPQEPPLVSTPSGVVDHIVATHRRLLGARKQMPVTIAGLDGEQVELTGAPGWTCDTRPAGGSSPFDTRLFVLALPNGDLIAIEIRKASFGGVDVDYEQFLREALPVVRSFQFGAAD